MSIIENTNNAGNSKGYKHTEQAKDNLRNLTFS